MIFSIGIILELEVLSVVIVCKRCIVIKCETVKTSIIDNNNFAIE